MQPRKKAGVLTPYLAKRARGGSAESTAHGRHFDFRFQRVLACRHFMASIQPLECARRFPVRELLWCQGGAARTKTALLMNGMTGSA
jgi:hypothetical protein